MVMMKTEMMAMMNKMVPLAKLLICGAHTLNHQLIKLGTLICFTNKETEAHGHSLNKSSRCGFRL